MSAAASTGCADLLMRKRFAILHLAYTHRIDADLVRCTFAFGWMRAEREYEPARVVSIDTVASRLSEWELWWQIHRQSNDVLHHVGMRLDAANSADAHTSAIFDDDLPDADRDPVAPKQRIAARAQADLHTDGVLAGLASRPGKRERQLARGVQIVADGGGREGVVAELEVSDRRERQLITRATVEIEALGLEAAA